MIALKSQMLEYQIVKTGFFLADGGAMFGAIPKRAWSRKYPSDEQNRCCLAMNCLLVWNDDRVVLLDTCGGCTYRDGEGNLRVTFPNARHWVGEKQWQNNA